MTVASEPPQPDQAKAAEQPVLTPKISGRWALKPAHLAMIGFWSVAYLIVSYIPLQSGSLWRQLPYGRWMIATGIVPQTDPLLPLAAGMRRTGDRWLSQVIYALIDSAGGIPWLSITFALTLLVAFLLLARAWVISSGRLGAAMLTTAAVLAIGWSRFTVPGPENFALLCLAALIWLMAECLPNSTDAAQPGCPRSRQRQLWFGVPLVTMLWANLDATVLFGLMMLACLVAGRAIDVLRRERCFVAAVADRRFRRWAVAFQLGLVAALIHPAGIDSLLLQLGWGPDWETVQIPHRLVIATWGGWEFAASWAVLLVVFRFSRSSIPAAHVLLLAAFSLLAVLDARRLAWYAMAYGVILLPHVTEIFNRFVPVAADADQEPLMPAEEPLLPAGKSWKYTLVAALLVWIGFAFSPLGQATLSGSGRTLPQLVGSATPLKLTEYMRHNPCGMTLAPLAWSDWLSAQVGDNWQPFTLGDLSSVPTRVQRDHGRFFGGAGNWDQIPERYRVQTIVLQRDEHRTQLIGLRAMNSWSLGYQDDQAVVFHRRRSEPTADGGAARQTDSGAAAPSPAERTSQDSQDEEISAPPP